jgi:hypothetical protein
MVEEKEERERNRVLGKTSKERKIKKRIEYL